MNKKELVTPKALFIDLNDRSVDNSISEKVTELKLAGYKQVEIQIKNSTAKENENLQLDIELFIQIKTVQDLPDWVIIKLILAEGKLKGSNFEEILHSG